MAKDLLTKILVKDPRKRIAIEEIKLHNFYLLGELLYKQTFENMGNINEYMLLVDDNEQYFDFDDLKDNDNIIINELNSHDFNSTEKMIKNYEVKTQKEQKQLNDEKNQNKN